MDIFQLDDRLKQYKKNSLLKTQLLLLESILFRDYINDLQQEVQSKSRIFADDVAIYLAVASGRGQKTLKKNK
jgi:hypothetical protein